MSMPLNTLPIQQIIQNAAQAMQRGDKRTARTWAQIAVSMQPKLEEPWLVLAAVSSPRAAIEYLKQALLVNPGSERAMRGLRCAQDQLAKQKQAAAPSLSATQPLVSATQPIPVRLPVVQPARESAPRPIAAAKTRRPVWGTLAAQKFSIPVLLLTLLCVVGAWAAWPGSTSSALGLINSGVGSDPKGPAWAQAQILKPTYTSAATATLPATATPLPTLTPTQTPTALPTDLPTSIPATDVPPVNIQVIGNYTVRAGDSLSGIAQRAGVTTAELAAANQISAYATIYPGQVLGIPLGGTIPDPITQPDPGTIPAGDPPAQYGEKYVLVDISEQHLYAYEGDTLVYSFVASTGMNNATRVGVFHVLDKIPNAYGATWDLWMPNWMGIYYSGSLENGIHALPILSNGSRLWAGYLGTPISYGCVVLGVEEAQWLYDWADVGTTVEIRR